MNTATTTKRKGDKGVVMEGLLAGWYAKNTRSEIGEMEAEARAIADGLAPDASVLEVAPDHAAVRSCFAAARLARRLALTRGEALRDS